ncbi:MAG TPA: helix-turn-helix transcriptional regulator, partial [Rhizomicrobium sp.]|nr:helix-turn-helix transcriptional regulator [Rhizomicrobium sp.]
AVLKKSFALTDREAEVLGWLSKGKSNRDIAVILDCSPRTVNKHLEQIYSKLQVENRTAAAMRAIHVLSTN